MLGLIKEKEKQRGVMGAGKHREEEGLERERGDRDYLDMDEYGWHIGRSYRVEYM